MPAGCDIPGKERGERGAFCKGTRWKAPDHGHREPSPPAGWSVPRSRVLLFCVASLCGDCPLISAHLRSLPSLGSFLSTDTMLCRPGDSCSQFGDVPSPDTQPIFNLQPLSRCSKHMEACRGRSPTDEGAQPHSPSSTHSEQNPALAPVLIPLPVPPSWGT